MCRPVRLQHAGVVTFHQTLNEGDSMADIHESFRRQGLVRPRDDRVLAGVCAGLGRRFGLEP